ncbi:extracellular matrix protein 3-like [Amphiura filiformis]|uniref:extracellular matrix protein 3-like n=1 Tax=Amphiura filiformis TaxID=82378 RepID=UPI003B225B03
MRMAKRLALLIPCIVVLLLTIGVRKVDACWTGEYLELNYMDCPQATANGECLYTEGDVARFQASVFPAGEPFSGNVPQPLADAFEDEQLAAISAIFWTEAGQLPTSVTPLVPDVDEATPQDYSSTFTEVDSYTSAFGINGITVDIIDDCEVETNEVFYGLLQIDHGAFRVFEEDIINLYESADITPTVWKGIIIQDNDDHFYIEKENYDINEDQGTFTFSVCRIGQLAEQRTIEYKTCDMTAVSTSPNPDFSAVYTNLVIPAGDTCAMGSVDIVNDPYTREDTEMFSINIVYNDPSVKGCTGKVINPSKAFVTIRDVMYTYFKIQFCEYAVTEPREGSFEFKFKIQRVGNHEATSTIYYNVTSISATAVKDYEPPASDIFTTINANTDSVELSIPIHADASREDPETFEISIGNPSSGIVSDSNKATVTIYDVSTSKSCARLDSAIYTVFEASEEVVLKIIRDGNLCNMETIAIETTDIDAVSSSSNGAIADFVSDFPNEFNFDQDQAELPITLTIINDEVKEDTECFKVCLKPPMNQENAMDICTPECATVMIKNDDAISPSYAFESSYFEVLEQSGSLRLNLIRSGDLGEASTAQVIVSEQGINSATLAEDFDFPSTVFFDINQSSSSLLIDIQTNDGFEGEEKFTLEILDADATQQSGIKRATVVICDNCECQPACVHGKCLPGGTCWCYPAYTGQQCDIPVVIVFESLTITESPPTVAIHYSDDLNDPTSASYIQMKAVLESELVQALNGLPGFLSVRVLRFRPGSVVVDYVVEFASNADANSADVRDAVNGIVDSNGILGNSNFKLTATATASESSNIRRSSSDGEVIGIIIGGVLGILILVLLGLLGLCVLYRRQNQLLAGGGRNRDTFELRPYEGPNQPYAAHNGILGSIGSPLY